jgi:integrase
MEAPMKIVVPLTELKIRNLKAESKRKKYFDGFGLMLDVMTSGRKYWRVKTTLDKKDVCHTLGHWPAMSLKAAREAAAEFNRTKGAPPADPVVTVRDLCDSWQQAFMVHFVPKEVKRKSFFINKYICSTIGDMDAKALTPSVILNQTLRPIEAAGYRETAHRVKSLMSQILRFGIGDGLVERDYTLDLKDSLAPTVVTHRPALIDKGKVARLMFDIFCYDGSPAVAYALRILPYVFVRPGELRHALWDEIDFEAKQWRIPAEKMKMRAPHIVPLADQVLSMLGELRKHTGDGELLFPGARLKTKPISDMAVNAALKYLGYEGKAVCAHGFRATASTLLNEMGYNSDWIERQLAHAERNGVRAAYNHADYLPERRKMMQDWADFLDGLREGVKP